MSNFRQCFSNSKIKVNWFPRHMFSGLKQMQAKLRSVDCIVEVHDSRIPLSGRNPNLSKQIIGPSMPHILVLNKCDLISSKQQALIRTHLEPTVNKIIFSNAKNDQDPGLKKIVSVMKTLIENSNRYHRSHVREYHSMIIGIPNVGKSSIINALRSKYMRKGRAVAVGPSAGVTKSVHMKVKISEAPIIYLFDTPGILSPRVPNLDTGMKLAACSNLPDADVGYVLIADYILFSLNRLKYYNYLEMTDLREPTDCIATVLMSIAVKNNFTTMVKDITSQQALQSKPDIQKAAQNFVVAFRKGTFGKVVMDNLEQQILTSSEAEDNFDEAEPEEIIEAKP